MALLRVLAAIMSAPGLCRTSSWTSWDAASHQSSQREPLMIGSVALPEFMAVTVAQLSQKTRTVVLADIKSRQNRRASSTGIEEDSDPGDAGGWTLALVLSCV